MPSKWPWKRVKWSRQRQARQQLGGNTMRSRDLHGRNRSGIVALAVGTLVAILTGLGVCNATPAVANTQPYELYCSGSPVGDVVMNGAETTGTISPASPGGQFNLTNYQTTVNIPAVVAQAAQGIQPDLEGSVTTKLDLMGATPATKSARPSAFEVPIPTPVPADGVPIAFPSTPSSVGPFTARVNVITVTEASTIVLKLVIGGIPISLDCTSYSNDSAPAGITPTPPSGSPISVVIATAQGPSITFMGSSTAVVGASYSLTVNTTGQPVPTLEETGRLPRGLYFVDNHNGTGALSGTPTSTRHESAVGTYPITFTAIFGKGKTKHVVTQTFSLMVSQ